MFWLLIGLTMSLAIAARSLWKVDQVYSIAAIIAGLVTFIWGFALAPVWFQLGFLGLLVMWSRFYLWKPQPRHSRHLVHLSKPAIKAAPSIC